METPTHSTPSVATASHPISTAIIVLLILGLGGFSSYEYYTNYKHTQAITSLATQNSNLSQQLSTASSTIATLNNSLAHAKADYAVLTDQYTQAANMNSQFENQLQNLSQTVGSLNTLASTDKELLAKYSKVYFLSENYTPAALTQLQPQYILPGHEPQFFLTNATSFLTTMIDAAGQAGVTLKVLSAYRSFDTQIALKTDYKAEFGSGANTFSADQGYSEHQLGTAVDLTDTDANAARTSFKESPAYTWMINNAYKYGFEMSYPPGNTYYIYEPWHWRFVGIALATYLHQHSEQFYDLDQRTIDTYLIKLFNPS